MRTVQLPILGSLFLGTLLLSTGTTASPWRSDSSPVQDRATGPVEIHEPPSAAGIAWFGTWEGALAEAKRTSRPILFMSAAPQCHSVPGVW